MHAEQATAMRALGMGDRGEDRDYRRGRREQYSGVVGLGGGGGYDSEGEYTDDSRSDVSTDMPFT